MKSKHKLMKRIFENQGMKVNFDSFGESIEESALSSGAAKTIEDAIARFNRLTSALERGVDPATQEEIEIVLMRDIVGPAMPMLRKAGIKAGESMQDTEEWLAAEAADMTARY
tara:strand:+ start:2001 stop:2339 length:339 start_codon:yes stop_codon:yes gene_type:complete